MVNAHSLAYALGAIWVRYVIGPALKTGIGDPVAAELKKHVKLWLKRFVERK